MSRWALPVAIGAAGLVAALAALAGLPVPATAQGQRTGDGPGRIVWQRQLSGDEPHYLLTAMSLAEDRDLNVADEYAAERYRAFHSPSLPAQGKATGTRKGGSGGRVVEPHDPLLPALLAVPATVGGWRAAKAVLAGMSAALAGLLVWTAVRRLSVPPAAAAVVVGLMTASPPVAVYATQVYPALPAALAVTAAVAALTGRLAGPGPVVVVFAAVVALPWLAVKYVPVAAALAGLALLRLWRAGRRRPTGLLTAGLAVMGLVYVAAHLTWYGGVTVYAAGSFFAAHGGSLSVLGTDPDVAGRSTRLVGLLVDRDFGLAAWQPAWLVTVPALAGLVRRRPAGWTAVAVPLAVGWLVASFVAATMHGFWFPGRHVLAVLPAAVLAVAWWAGTGRRRLVLIACLGVVGTAAYAVLVTAGWQGTASWIYPTPAHRWLGRWLAALPDYRRLDPAAWTLHGLWVVATGGLTAWGWRTARGGADRLAHAAERTGG